VNAADMLAVTVDQLRAMTPAGLDARENELAALPASLLNTEIRLEIELERAGRHWHRVHDLAGLIGWEAAVAPGAVPRTRVGAA
jgi:hypothetical protein